MFDQLTKREKILLLKMLNHSLDVSKTLRANRFFMSDEYYIEMCEKLVKKVTEITKEDVNNGK